MVAGRIVDDLPHRPRLRSLRDEDSRRGTGVRAGADRVVLLEVGVQRVRPADIRVEGDELVVVLQRGQLDAPPEFVPHQHEERASVRDDASRRGRHDGRIHGSRRRQLGADGGQCLPLIEQTRINLSHQLAEPLDQVPQLVVLRLIRNGLTGRPERV